MNKYHLAHPPHTATPTATSAAETPTDMAPQKTLLQRETSLLAGEHNANQREEKADRRQENADQRQENADLRQKAADLSEEAARIKAELNEISAAYLREANERLVLATIKAQTMAEAAETATAQMHYMAHHDVLTGLPNRALLNDRLAQAIAAAQRHGKHVALMYLDLDHFKHINDSLGHAVGDQLLQSAAKRLQGCLSRASDTVSRQGGDEFVVLLTEIDTAQEATITAEKLIESMTEPHLIGGHRLHVTLSIGISLYPDDGLDVDTLFKNADTAMYHAKKIGRDNYQMFTPDMNAHAVARRSIEDALRHGLEERRFVLHYQPKINLETGAITGAEALVRLQHADQPLTYPTEFISVAENSGLILPLGKWVLREVCRQVAEWLHAGIDVGRIAVNVSAVEFHSTGFFTSIRDVLSDTGLDPRYLELEMTESGLMQDTARTIDILNKLKTLGVQVAIDDFGTGYSSLSYLRRFPIDTLKIDQSFVKDIDDEPNETAIVSAIIAMGKSLKIHVIAEGIETPHQLATLQFHQCAEGQGYFFNQPLPAKDFAALLKTTSTA